MNFQATCKPLIGIILIISFCAFTNRKPQICLKGNTVLTNDTIPEIVISSEKAKRYKTYLNHCNEIVKDTILQTGYLNFDHIENTNNPKEYALFG